MKRNRIRLTESDLNRIVKESVKRLLNEGENLDSQESYYIMFANLEQDLKTIISNTDSSSNQAFGSPDEKLKAIVNGLSHVNEDLAKKTEMTFGKLLEVIDELQDIRISLKTLGAKDTYLGHNFKTPNGTVGLSNYN